jgi:radical SAM superfamily enzyme YgiQ (UPF0313 family)
MKIVFIGSSTMGPRFIMGFLKKHGHECFGVYQGLDKMVGEKQLSFFSTPLESEMLKQIHPDIVGISSCSFDYHDLSDITRQIKKILPDSLIVFGGIHPTLCPEEVISQDEVDIVCIGEGEYPMLDLCQALENGTDYSKIANLWVKKDDKITKNGSRPYPENLDEFPLDREGMTFYGIFSGRGCAGNCFFCNTPTIRKTAGTGKYFRKRSVGDVIKEIQGLLDGTRNICNLELLRRLAIKSSVASNLLLRITEKLAIIINKKPLIRSILKPLWNPLSFSLPDLRFKDDTFLSNRQWFLDFAKVFADTFPHARYICQARANEIDEEVAIWLKKSRCVRVSIGIECGNEQYRLKVMKKAITNKQIECAVKLLKQNGIEVMGQWIVGMPGETPEMVLESLLLHNRIGDIPQLHIAVPFPKTRMHEIAVEKGLIPADFTPIGTLYDDFLFYEGYEKALVRILYNLFPASRIKIPREMEDLDFEVRSGRRDFHHGLTLGEMLSWGWYDDKESTELEAKNV